MNKVILTSKEFIVSEFFRLQNFHAVKIMNSDQPLLLQIVQNEPGRFFVEMENAAEPVEYERKRNDFLFATLLDL